MHKLFAHTLSTLPNRNKGSTEINSAVGYVILKHALVMRWTKNKPALSRLVFDIHIYNPTYQDNSWGELHTPLQLGFALTSTTSVQLATEFFQQP